jgi:hypothetical protein
MLKLRYFAAAAAVALAECVWVIAFTSTQAA